MALLQNINFTDPQGVTHPTATFGVSYANSYVNVTTTLNRNMEDMTTMVENVNASRNLQVQYYYWADEEKRLANMSPYILANMNDGLSPPTMSFTFDPSGPEYENLSVEDQALYYLQNNLLSSAI